jgi:hypothetical protein
VVLLAERRRDPAGREPADGLVAMAVRRADHRRPAGRVTDAPRGG